MLFIILSASYGWRGKQGWKLQCGRLWNSDGNCSKWIWIFTKFYVVKWSGANYHRTWFWFVHQELLFSRKELHGQEVSSKVTILIDAYHILKRIILEILENNKYEIINCRNFLVTNVAQHGNCFIFNSEYNLQDTIMYVEGDEGYYDTGKRRISTLTGPSFGLNLIINLDQINYMKGEITKQVC